MKKVAIFGTGYVGCVTAGCLSRDGHQVIGVDIDEDKVATINQGKTPVSEPGLDEMVAEQVAAGNLSATSDVEAAVRATEIALVAVGTPSRSDGGVTTDALENVIKSIGTVLRQSGQPYTIVIRSTLLPGILEGRLATLLAETAGRPLGDQLRICNNPEFLRESSAIKDYDNPPFVVVGVTDDFDGRPVLDLYKSVGAPEIVTDSRTAALIKYTCNAFHALKVVFANEIGSLAKTFEADGCEVMRLVCQDDKLNISPAYLRPGFAFGGSCLPKDLRALIRHAQQEALSIDVLSAILPSNDQHLQRALQVVKDTQSRRVGLVGLSFKAGTDDLRESPQVILAETLLGKGYELKIFDPGVTVSRLRGRNLAYVDQHLPHLAALLVESEEDFYNHADVLVLATNVADAISWQTGFRGDIIDLREDLVRAKPSPACSTS